LERFRAELPGLAFAIKSRSNNREFRSFSYAREQIFFVNLARSAANNMSTSSDVASVDELARSFVVTCDAWRRTFLALLVLPVVYAASAASASSCVDGSTACSSEEAAADAAFKAYIDAGIKAANAEAVSNAQKVGKFAIAPVDFSIDGGELTATMKLKRKAVSEKYQELIEEMYA